jgi:hypothetical protein
VSEENIRGVLSVGAPVRDRNGKVLAALSVALPKYLDADQTLQSITPWWSPPPSASRARSAVRRRKARYQRNPRSGCGGDRP